MNNQINETEAFLFALALLAEAGISTTMHICNGSLTASFVDGFYKSDGCAYLKAENGRLYLHARYGEKTEIQDINDVIKCSKQWYERSKDRFDGWRTPPANWASLYSKLGD